jgi:ABC-type bacteriocin/lantibiotic exporter with double-glycine peptidase domain
MSFSSALGTVLVLWFGGRMVIDGAMTVGKLVEFLLFLNLSISLSSGCMG